MKYSWELSPFDTEILGFNTAKINNIDSAIDRKIKNNVLSVLKNDLKKHNIMYATHRLSASDYSMIQSLEENGFILIDGLITLQADLNSIQESNFTHIEEATKRDYLQLIDLAGRVFRGISRYYHDPVISTEKADTIYRQWMKNSLNGSVADLVLILKEEQNISGFITMQKKGHIPLIGVSEEMKGKGVGYNLTCAALAWFKKWGLKKVYVETQMTNISALRLYHSCGFKITASHLTFRWFFS